MRVGLRAANEPHRDAARLTNPQSRFVGVSLNTAGLGGAAREAALAAAAGATGLPAFVVGQLCRFVDLDGPLLQRRDRESAIRYDGAVMPPPPGSLWG